MFIFKTVKDLQAALAYEREQHSSLAFVPTMGALHAGHLSLVKLARSLASKSIASIYVNPAQFNRKEDLDKYPRMPEQDIVLLEKAGCDYLFMPEPSEIEAYAAQLAAPPPLSEALLKSALWSRWEAEFRPGHFEGVVFIVDLLLRIVNPDTLIMGQKDYQQFSICRAMARERFPDLRMIMAETGREESGLAMSSRNLRLSLEARRKAAGMYASLQKARQKIHESDSVETTLQEILEEWKQSGFWSPEYLSLVDAQSLEPLHSRKPAQRAVLLAAAWAEGVRLIDNILID